VVSITALCFISTTFRPASKSSKDILMQIKKTNLTFWNNIFIWLSSPTI
jgi:hypothetical protein